MDVYSIITSRIIEKLEQGTVPWHQPWRKLGAPRNLVSGKTYRGINIWLLLSQKFVSPYWLSYKQAQELGGNVREGEKATPVVFWKVYCPETENAPESEPQPTESDRRFVLRYYRVFNSEQCDLPESVRTKIQPPGSRHIDPIEACEKVLAEMPNPPTIEHGTAQAYYSPSTDRVSMPARQLFESAEEYYATLFHELGHAAGAERRLSRSTLKELSPFGSGNYSKEELIAEMTAAFLCGHCRIENRTIDNSAAYVSGWLKRLRDDRRLVIDAAAQAQHAADYILGVWTEP